MVNHDQDEVISKAMVPGIVVAMSGLATFVASAISLKLEFPDVESIPNPLFGNLDSVTAKLFNSGMILIIAGMILMAAGAMYARSKQNSSTPDSTQENDQVNGDGTIGQDPLSINSSNV